MQCSAGDRCVWPGFTLTLEAGTLRRLLGRRPQFHLIPCFRFHSSLINNSWSDIAHEDREVRARWTSGFLHCLVHRTRCVDVACCLRMFWTRAWRICLRDACLPLPVTSQTSYFRLSPLLLSASLLSQFAIRSPSFASPPPRLQSTVVMFDI